MNDFRKLLFYVLLLPAFIIGSAQKTPSDANLVGDVQCDGKHVPYATVTIDGTNMGTNTDATGHYQITNLPEGSYTVRVSCVGYKTKTQKFTASTNSTTEIKFIVEEDLLNIEGVVVSADRKETNRAEAPVVINSVTAKLFETTQSVNIAEGLNYTPGLRTECNCQNCGFTQLRMNGMDGPYTQILMNSRPVFSGLAGVYGLELIPANMVERMEVIRGGGSALFGGNAIAGTVNIITKEPSRNTYSVDGRYSLTGIGGNEGTPPAGDAQLNVNASLVTEDNKSGAYVYGMLRDRESYDENGDGYSEAVTIENSTFGFSAYHKPGLRSKITLDGYRINDFRRGGNKLEYLPHEADICEQVEHNITGVNLAYDLFTNDKYNKLTVYAAGQHVKRDSYYGAQQDANAYGYTTDFTSSIGAQYIFNSNNFLFSPASTILGIDNNTNIIDDQKLGANGNPNTTLTNQGVNTIGSFLQHDWKGKKLNLSLGLRYDNYFIRDLSHGENGKSQEFRNGVFAPRVNAMYKITPDLRFRLGYAKGYRAPQVFNEDLHIEMVNARRIEHFNDENLTQESSHAFTSSINYNVVIGSTVTDFLTEGFYTRLENAFADEYYELDTLGSWAYKRVNASAGAYVTGINLELNTHLNSNLELHFGFTFQKSRFEEDQQWGEEAESASSIFLRSPDQYGYATLDWQMFKNFSTSLALNYTGSMFVPHFGLDPETNDPLEQEAIANGDVISGERLEKTEQFLIVDLLFTKTFALTKESKLQMYGGIKNVFNQMQAEHDSGVFRDAGYIYGPCQPRTINIGIRIGNF